LKQVLSCE